MTTETHLESTRTSTTVLFYQERFIVNVPLGSRYTSGLWRKLRKIGDTELFFSIFEPILKHLLS